MRLLCLAAVCAAQTTLACPAPEDAVVLTSSDNAAPTAYATIDTLPLSAPFEVQIAFCGTGTESISEIAFDAVMPAHQHGMNYVVEITNSEGNHFEVSNVVFHMPGLWQMNVSAELAGQTYEYEAEVTLK